MKKYILLLSFLSISKFVSAQNCDSLQLENQRLKAQLLKFGINQISNATVHPFTDKIKVNYISAIGDKNNQTVTINLNITNPTLPNQTVTLLSNYAEGIKLLNVSAIDEIGNGYKAIDAKFGANNGFHTSNTLSTGGSPIMISITYANILPDVKKLSVVNFFLQSQNLLLGDNRIQGLIEIKNIIIDWK